MDEESAASPLHAPVRRAVELASRPRDAATARRAIWLAAAAAVGLGIAALTFASVRRSAAIALDRTPLLEASADLNPPGEGLAGITFVTAETRGAPLIAAPAMHFREAFGADVVNVGLGKQWGSFRTKVELFAQYLRLRLGAVGYEAPGNVEEHLVAFFDGGDVLYGGCNVADFKEAYAAITSRSGARIVFSAEVVCGEQDCDRVPAVPEWAADLSHVDNLDSGFWAKYAVGCNGTWKTILNDDGVPCVQRRDCGYWAPCSDPPAVKFLNSGFFMGPMLELSEMLEWSLLHYEQYSVWGDQSVFSQYWLENPDKVTLDYLGQLTLSLSDLRPDVIAVSPEGGGKVINEAFGGRQQCFVHGNGRGRWLLKNLVQAVTGLPFGAVRGF